MKTKAHLFGLGLDNDDGHTRVTRADNFTINGGSQETHERLAETAIKTNEELKKRGKQLETIDRRELAEIIQKHSE
jgi:hypothetical protein